MAVKLRVTRIKIRGKGVSLPDSSRANKPRSMNTINNQGERGRGKAFLNPRNPKLRKFILHRVVKIVNHSIVLNAFSMSISANILGKKGGGFLRIRFQRMDNFLDNKDIIESRLARSKTIMLFANKLVNNFFKMKSHNFRNDFIRYVTKRNRPKINELLGIIGFGNKDYNGFSPRIQKLTGFEKK